MTVAFGDLLVLDQISLTLLAGDRLLVTGRSGAGKSTLLHAVAGLVPVRSGHIAFDGLPLQALKDSQLSLVRRSMGFVFQQATLFDEITPVENIAWVGQLRGMSRSRSLEEAESLLALLGLSDRGWTSTGVLSGGEAQRVNLARGLIGGVRLLLVDEPTASLDEDGSHLVCQLIEKATESLGVAAIIVSHDPIAAKYVDRVSTLADHGLSTS